MMFLLIKIEHTHKITHQHLYPYLSVLLNLSLPHPFPLSLSLFLRINGHFTGGIGLAGTRMFPLWILLKQDDGGGEW